MQIDLLLGRVATYRVICVGPLGGDHSRSLVRSHSERMLSMSSVETYKEREGERGRVKASLFGTQISHRHSRQPRVFLYY